MNRARAEANKIGVVIIEHTPCLEKMLLPIVNGKHPASADSEEYKKEFESKYIERKKRGDSREYERVFPKELLDSKRKSTPELDALIQIMQR